MFSYELYEILRFSVIIGDYLSEPFRNVELLLS